MSVSRRRTLTLVALALLIGAVAVGSFVAPPYVHRYRARRALDAHDPVTARAILARSLESGSYAAADLLLAAKADRCLGEYGRAERGLTEAEKAGGPSEEIGFEGQLLGLCQGDFAGEELGVKQLADRNDPRAADAMFALAKGYFVAFRHGETTQICDRLIGQDPKHVAAYLLRGDVADISRKHEDAEKDYRAAVAAGPRNALARSALARFLAKKGETREALAHFELARQFGATDAATRLGLARAWGEDGQPDRARAVLDELLAADANHADALTESARLALRRDDPAAARPWLERALATAPWHREATALAAVAYEDLNLTAERDETAGRLTAFRAEDGRYGVWKLKARDNGGDVAVRLALAAWCQANGRPVEGVTWLSEVLRIDPKNAAAHRGFARYYDATGQPLRAAAHRHEAGTPPVTTP
jgi:Tfp pilus assembly protein PilF